MFTLGEPHSNQASVSGKRTHASPHFTLLELSPSEVIEGKLVANGFLAEPVTPAGQMRETCPKCSETPLQLVLRYAHVIRPHLFCPKCTRCYDAVYPDGSSALAMTCQSID